MEAQGQTANQCRQNQNLQLQNSGTVSTQTGYAPVRLEAQGQTAVQCKQGDSSSRTVAGQFQVRGHEPGRLEAQGQTVVQCRQNQNLQLQNSGTVSIQTGYAPVRLEARGQTAVQCKQGDSSQQQSNSSQKITFQTEPREIGGSAQALLSGGLRGGGLYGLPEAEKTVLWHKGKSALGKTDLEQPERERILYRLAEICTSMMRDNRSRVGDVARPLGGILVTPPVDPDYIRRYVGKIKGFPKIDELITIVSGGVPVIAPPSQADLESALRYRNHRSAEEHLPLIIAEKNAS